MKDSELGEALYRIKHGLTDEAKIDRRGRHFDWRMITMITCICKLYECCPEDFHHDKTDKIIIEKLLQHINTEIDKNTSAFKNLPVSEKSIRKAINLALKRNMIPRFLRSKF